MTNTLKRVVDMTNSNSRALPVHLRPIKNRVRLVTGHQPDCHNRHLEGGSFESRAVDGTSRGSGYRWEILECSAWDCGYQVLVRDDHILAALLAAQ